MQRGDGLVVRAIGADLVPVPPHPFLAARGLQKPPVILDRPVPVQPRLCEGAVEGFAMGFLGLGKCAINIEDQGLRCHAASANRRSISVGSAAKSEKAAVCGICETGCLR